MNPSSFTAWAVKIAVVCSFHLTHGASWNACCYQQPTVLLMTCVCHQLWYACESSLSCVVQLAPWRMQHTHQCILFPFRPTSRKSREFKIPISNQRNVLRKAVQRRFFNRKCEKRSKLLKSLQNPRNEPWYLSEMHRKGPKIANTQIAEKLFVSLWSIPPTQACDFVNLHSPWLFEGSNQYDTKPHSPFSSIFAHIGSITRGHYFIFIKSKGQWLRLDDHTVTLADPREAIQQQFGELTRAHYVLNVWDIRLAAAYLCRRSRGGCQVSSCEVDK